MWIVMLILLLLSAHLNLTAIVPLKPGDPLPPWWVGGRLVWPFAVETRTLLQGDLLNTVTPLLAISSAVLFVMAAAALLRWRVPRAWFRGLVAAACGLSVVLQVIWLTGWAVLPLVLDAALLWAVFARHVSVDSLRPAARTGEAAQAPRVGRAAGR